MALLCRLRCIPFLAQSGTAPWARICNPLSELARTSYGTFRTTETSDLQKKKVASKISINYSHRFAFPDGNFLASLLFIAVAAAFHVAKASGIFRSSITKKT